MVGRLVQVCTVGERHFLSGRSTCVSVRVSIVCLETADFGSCQNAVCYHSCIKDSVLYVMHFVITYCCVDAKPPHSAIQRSSGDRTSHLQGGTQSSPATAVVKQNNSPSMLDKLKLFGSKNQKDSTKVQVKDRLCFSFHTRRAD
jgi:hypothetical protein